jgi:hypothetical protein
LALSTRFEECPHILNDPEKYNQGNDPKDQAGVIAPGVEG